MHIRIAILVLPGAAMQHSRPGPSGNDPPCPADCVILDGRGPVCDRLSVPCLLETTRRARACDATHLAVLPGWTPSFRTDLERLIQACRAHPEAVIIGRRPGVSRTGLRDPRHGRSWPRFWLKIQTGCRLKDPLSPLRLYPLAILEHLRLYQRGKPLGTEILVKSAWAGVPLKEVRIAGGGAVPGMARAPMWEPIWHFLLNIHFTLRSVLPVPHRKLVPHPGRTGQTISVWRPVRSLRTLLGENAAPMQLALAAAVGVFLGTLPLIACHTLIIILAATYFRLNKVVALSASQLCMPPVVPALCIETGYWLRHGRFLTEISLDTLGYQALQRLYEWLLGALVLAPLLACLTGGATLLLSLLATRGAASVRPFKPTPENGVEP